MGDRGDPVFPQTSNLITDYFFLSFGRKNSGEVKRNTEAKMPPEFLSKKNCPYSLRGLIHYESFFFFYMQYVQNVYTMYTQYLHNVYTMYTQCVHNVYTVYAQCIHNVYTIYVHYVYTLYTLCVYY